MMTIEISGERYIVVDGDGDLVATFEAHVDARRFVVAARRADKLERIRDILWPGGDCYYEWNDGTLELIATEMDDYRP